VDKGFLKALLRNVFGILSDACEVQSDDEYLAPVALDKDFERLFISVLGGEDECLVPCRGAKEGNGRSGFIGPINKAG
jgi:hypothetical protein